MKEMARKIIFFDTGPIITLVMSRLAYILPKLKEKMKGEFYITPSVERELVERPLQNKRFEFEALEVQKFIREGILKVYKDIPKKKVNELISLANSTFTINNKTMDVIQEGEMESVAAALETKAEAVIIDERTLRLFIESCKDMQALLEQRFQHKVDTDLKKMKQFSSYFKSITILRSVELVSVAYKIGLLNSYIPSVRNGKETLLDAVLWATKYNGCAVTEHEIEEIKQTLLR